MADTVEIAIPVSRSVADQLRTEEDRRRVGRLVGALLAARVAEPDPLIRLLDRMRSSTAAAGLTDEMVDEELAAYNAERRN